MQAAIYIREKQRLRRKSNFRRGRLELPSHVATREIAPFPQYPPHNWVRAKRRQGGGVLHREGTLLRAARDFVVAKLFF